MKKLFMMVLLSTLLPLSVLADESSPTPEAPKVREATVRGVIRKNFVERSGDMINTRSEQVCAFEGKIPVYEARNMPSYFYRWNSFASCASTAGGKEVKVMVSGSMIMKRIGNDKIQAGEGKFAVLALATVYAADSRPALPALQSFFGSRDVNSDSLIVYLQPDYWSQPNVGDELFSVEAEIVDKQ